MLHAAIVDAWLTRARALATAHRVEPFEDIDARVGALADRLLAECEAAREKALPGVMAARLQGALAEEEHPRARHVLGRMCALISRNP